MRGNVDGRRELKLPIPVAPNDLRHCNQIRLLSFWRAASSIKNNRSRFHVVLFLSFRPLTSGHGHGGDAVLDSLHISDRISQDARHTWSKEFDLRLAQQSTTGQTRQNMCLP